MANYWYKNSSNLLYYINGGTALYTTYPHVGQMAFFITFDKVYFLCCISCTSVFYKPKGTVSKVWTSSCLFKIADNGNGINCRYRIFPACFNIPPMPGVSRIKDQDSSLN